MPTLRPPEAIALYSLPLLRNLARAVTRASNAVDRRLYRWQVGRFIRDPKVRDELVPFLYQQFLDAGNAVTANATAPRDVFGGLLHVYEAAAA